MGREEMWGVRLWSTEFIHRRVKSEDIWSLPQPCWLSPLVFFIFIVDCLLVAARGFSCKGFPRKSLCLLMIRYLSYHTCWLVAILLAIGAILFKFMVYGWDWHMMHAWVLWYVADGDWCVSELIFISIFPYGKFGQHHVWRIDIMGLCWYMHIRSSLKCFWMISLLILTVLLPLCAHKWYQTC